MYWKKASAFGAIVSMFGGMVIWFVALLLLPETPGETNPVWMHVPPMLYGFAAGILGMVIGSLVRPERRVDAVDTWQ